MEFSLVESSSRKPFISCYAEEKNTNCLVVHFCFHLTAVRTKLADHQAAHYLLGYVSFFAGQLSFPLCVCDALSELVL